MVMTMEVNLYNNTRAGIEKGLEMNLEEYLKFLQILAKETKGMAAASRASRAGQGDEVQKLEMLRVRPDTAPLSSLSDMQVDHVETYPPSKFNFDDGTVRSDDGSTDESGLCMTKSERSSYTGVDSSHDGVSDQVELDWNSLTRRHKPWCSVHVMPSLGSDEFYCRPMSTDTQHCNGLVRTWSVEPISECASPKSNFSSDGTCPKEKVIPSL